MMDGEEGCEMSPCRHVLAVALRTQATGIASIGSAEDGALNIRP